MPTPATDAVRPPVRPRAVATVAVAGSDLQQWPYTVVCCEGVGERLAVVAEGLARVAAGLVVERDPEVVLVMVCTLAFAKVSSHSLIHQPTEFQRPA